jgi:NADP-dependent 3-hydroxy acid dehydrogenase YdfG
MTRLIWSRGIGRYRARHRLRPPCAGAEVFMLGRSMERLAEPLRLRRKCHLVAADLTDSHAISRVGAKIASRKRMDVLVLSSERS